MPELPDIVVYVEALRERIQGEVLESLEIVSPFVLRTVEPPIEEAAGKTVLDVRRLGKRVVLSLADDLFLVFHLMVAGRFRWKRRGSKPPGKITLATFCFPDGILILTEAGKKKRASLHLVCGEAAVAGHDPGGLEVLDADEAAFRAAVSRRGACSLSAPPPLARARGRPHRRDTWCRRIWATGCCWWR
ncbi:MAG: hypothetical protein IH987_12480 [Planctomycetes bacterium]|nr:hypothetical protein [Planctomycetota bacterium]